MCAIAVRVLAKGGCASDVWGAAADVVHDGRAGSLGGGLARAKFGDKTAEGLEGRHLTDTRHDTDDDEGRLLFHHFFCGTVY